MFATMKRINQNLNVKLVDIPEIMFSFSIDLIDLIWIGAEEAFAMAECNNESSVVGC